MELDHVTYNLTRKLYSDARRLLANSSVNKTDHYAYVEKEDLERLKETLEKLKNVKKE